MNSLKSTIIGKTPISFLRPLKFEALSSINELKESIENSINSTGFRFRKATINDIENISAFQRKTFYPHAATLETDYELFRIIEFGFALLIETIDNEIVGCYTTMQYNYGSLKIGYGIRVSVSETISGGKIAVKLARYAMLLAFENDCVYFHALMSPSNFKSASNVLNHLGYTCTRYFENLPSFGSRFEIRLWLSLETLNNSEIDIDKIISFTKLNVSGTDYLLINAVEIDEILHTYKFTDFMIIAFLKKGLIDDNNYFFAIRINNQDELG